MHVSMKSSTPRRHIFDGGPGGVMFTSLQVLDMYSDDLYFQGGSVTLCSDLPLIDPTLPQKIYFEMKMYAGYQHVYTLVYNEDGEYVDTVYPARGLRETTSIETSCAEGRLRGLAETVQQPTLKVDIEVEGNLVPAAVAGHFTFPKPEGCAGARKYYTCAVDNPAPEPDTPTELIAVSLNRNDGFVLKSWTGNCAYFDANGNYLGMLPESLPDDPDDWVTGDTIYVKCLKAQPTQMASAMTDMAVLAGATAEGAFEGFLEPVEARLNANLVRGALVVTGAGFPSHQPGDEDAYTAAWDVSALRKIGYSVKPIPEKGSSCIDIDVTWALPIVKVFTYFGHAWNSPIQLKLGKSGSDDATHLTPAEVMSEMRGNTLGLVLLSGCYTFQEEWRIAFGADTLIGWDGFVTPKGAAAFEKFFWEQAKISCTAGHAYAWASRDYEMMHTPEVRTTGKPRKTGRGSFELNPAGRDK